MSRLKDGGFLWVAICVLVVIWSIGTAQAQTNQVYSATTASCENQSAYGCATAAWRVASPPPLLVASGRTATCRWGSTPILWTKPANLQPTWCVSFGSTNGFVAASTLGWPPANNPPVNCVVSDWSAWNEGPWSQCIDGTRSRTDQRSRSVVTPASNGGTACPALTESRTVSEACTLPPPPRVSVVISITSQRVYTNEPVTVSWTSQNALSCAASWTQDVVPPSGSQSLTMTAPMAFARVYVRCLGVASEYEAGTGFVVLSRSPDCYPKLADRNKIAFKSISSANMTLRYQLFAVWFCATPDGPKQERWAIGAEQGIAKMREVFDGIFDEQSTRAVCDSSCETLPSGALRTELEEFARLHTPESLGVID